MDEAERKERKLKRFLWIPIIGVALLVGLLSFIVAVRLFSPEDTWICTDGQWVEHGKPSSPKPELECTKKSDSSDDTKGPQITDVKVTDPVTGTHNAVNSLPEQNPIGPVQIKGFFSFMAPVADIMADFGAKICEWGRPPEVANTCPSIKIEFQEFFSNQSK
jgi:hypothetical protein